MIARKRWKPKITWFMEKIGSLKVSSKNMTHALSTRQLLPNVLILLQSNVKVHHIDPAIGDGTYA